MTNEELSNLFSKVTNFYDITHSSICEYCKYHMPATCGYSVCNKDNPPIYGLTRNIQACKEFELESGICLISEHLCKTCDHCSWKFNRMWGLEFPICGFGNKVGIADITDCKYYDPHKLFIINKENDER